MNTIDFMKRFSRLSVDGKMKTIKSMDTMAKPTNATPQQLKTFEALKKWCGVSIIVGEELCPPTLEHLQTYL